MENKNYVYGACKDTVRHLEARLDRKEISEDEAWEGLSIVREFLEESVKNNIQEKNWRVKNLLRLIDHDMWELEEILHEGQ